MNFLPDPQMASPWRATATTMGSITARTHQLVSEQLDPFPRSSAGYGYRQHSLDLQVHHLQQRWISSQHSQPDSWSSYSQVDHLHQQIHHQWQHPSDSQIHQYFIQDSRSGNSDTKKADLFHRLPRNLRSEDQDLHLRRLDSYQSFRSEDLLERPCTKQKEALKLQGLEKTMDTIMEIIRSIKIDIVQLKEEMTSLPPASHHISSTGPNSFRQDVTDEIKNDDHISGVSSLLEGRRIGVEEFSLNVKRKAEVTSSPIASPIQHQHMPQIPPGIIPTMSENILVRITPNNSNEDDTEPKSDILPWGMVTQLKLMKFMKVQEDTKVLKGRDIDAGDSMTNPLLSKTLKQGNHEVINCSLSSLHMILLIRSRPPPKPPPKPPPQPLHRSPPKPPPESPLPKLQKKHPWTFIELVEDSTTTRWLIIVRFVNGCQQRGKPSQQHFNKHVVNTVNLSTESGKQHRQPPPHLQQEIRSKNSRIITTARTHHLRQASPRKTSALERSAHNQAREEKMMRIDGCNSVESPRRCNIEPSGRLAAVEGRERRESAETFQQTCGRSFNHLHKWNPSPHAGRPKDTNLGGFKTRAPPPYRLVAALPPRRRRGCRCVVEKKGSCEFGEEIFELRSRDAIDFGPDGLIDTHQAWMHAQLESPNFLSLSQEREVDGAQITLSFSSYFIQVDWAGSAREEDPAHANKKINPIQQLEEA